MGEHLKILIVDDAKDDRLLNAHIATKTLPGVAIFEAQSGQEALEFLKTRVMDLIMTDDRMIGMDGLMLVQKIRERDPVTPILVVSLNLGVHEKMLEAGASAFVSKMDAAAIARHLRALLAEREGASKPHPPVA